MSKQSVDFIPSEFFLHIWATLDTPIFISLTSLQAHEGNCGYILQTTMDYF